MEKRPLTLLHRYRPPSDVFINSSQIQLVGLFVRRVSLSSPFHPSSILSFRLSLPLSCLARFIPHPLLEGERERRKTGNCREEERRNFPSAPNFSTRYTRHVFSRND